MQVDVVTAVHASHAAFLPAAWGSLLAQSHTRWRWLVQIDGPSDEVRAVLNACAATEDPRVLVASHGTYEGPAITRNVALGRGSAPLVQNVDADDELETDALAVLATALDTHPDAGYAVGYARDLMADGTLVDHPLPVPSGTLPRGVLPRTWKAGPAEYRVPVHPAGVMWRRPLLLALGGWSALRGMEDTGALMAASAAAEGVLVDAPTLRYRRHAAQRSKQTSKFAGGGAQIALIRERTAVLSSLPPWKHAFSDFP
ncbi:glycosyltransferase family A protein [Streptomyces sp. PTY087I2]|uniref:glycosyltransferase family A protein n=1 Tax=Streptomyces sp. PTY087I2 TaxID=1819298 RepID=UPI00080B2BB1|nr:glycosyltransferase family A protein [Streptomyces sp. PTY087I2]OCC11576.1 Glycosyl transferase family 2 [Streptomyces sp. PTY087I2]